MKLVTTQIKKYIVRTYVATNQSQEDDRDIEKQKNIPELPEPAVSLFPMHGPEKWRKPTQAETQE